MYAYKYVIHTLQSITADRASQIPATTPDAWRNVRTGLSTASVRKDIFASHTDLYQDVSLASSQGFRSRINYRRSGYVFCMALVCSAYTWFQSVQQKLDQCIWKCGSGSACSLICFNIEESKKIKVISSNLQQACKWVFPKLLYVAL